MPVSDLASVTPAHQAARILAAWTSRNSVGLHEELRRSFDLCCPDQSRGLQEERLQLLQAVAEGMRHAPDPLQAGDRKLERCLELLRHLAQTP
jgi:hypothetical protein